MKIKLAFLLTLFCLFAVIGCSAQTVTPDPNANITLGMAFDHCIGTASYVIWLIIATVVCVGIILYIAFKTPDATLPLVFVALFILRMAVFMRPIDVANNTTYQMAENNQYIGY